MKTLNHHRKAFAFALTLALMLTSFSFAFAGTEPVVANDNPPAVSEQALLGVGLKAISNCSIGVTRVSDTKGETTINGALSHVADVSTCTAILQEKSGTSWITATGLSIYKQYNVRTNQSGIYLYSTWTLIKGKNYRLYVTIEEKLGTSYYSNSYYSDMF